MRVVAAALLLAACAAQPAPSAPPPAPRAEVPPHLRQCLPPFPAPPVPQPPRTVERLAAYAWAEAEGRWRTAGRLAQCDRKLRELNAWIEDRALVESPLAHDRGLILDNPELIR